MKKSRITKRHYKRYPKEIILLKCMTRNTLLDLYGESDRGFKIKEVQEDANVQIINDYLKELTFLPGIAVGYCGWSP